MADPQQGGDGAPSAAFTIDKIYLKDLSLESPGAPQSFLNQEQPQVEVGLRTRGEQVQPDVYECSEGYDIEDCAAQFHPLCYVFEFQHSLLEDGRGEVLAGISTRPSQCIQDVAGGRLTDAKFQ